MIFYDGGVRFCFADAGENGSEPAWLAVEPLNQS